VIGGANLRRRNWHRSAKLIGGRRLIEVIPQQFSACVGISASLLAVVTVIGTLIIIAVCLRRLRNLRSPSCHVRGLAITVPYPNSSTTDGPGNDSKRVGFTGEPARPACSSCRIDRAAGYDLINVSISRRSIIPESLRDRRFFFSDAQRPGLNALTTNFGFDRSKAAGAAAPTPSVHFAAIPRV